MPGPVMPMSLWHQKVDAKKRKGGREGRKERKKGEEREEEREKERKKEGRKKMLLVSPLNKCGNRDPKQLSELTKVAQPDYIRNTGSSPGHCGCSSVGWSIVL